MLSTDRSRDEQKELNRMSRGNMDEPRENLLADVAIRVMREWMPENGTIHYEHNILWGRIWEEMRTKLNEVK